ncbi:transporter associated domain-containing protein, partial [Richelia intracellularis]|uniref:transporter associated domain-containing protein n=1 Tax=Richelia intracellularis TaxID=1164990 RepID=UPI002F2B66AF
VRFVPENTLLKDLLPTMQQAKPTMVIVVDEFGGTSGLVTIQDVIAQIIGETGEADSTDEVFKLLNEQTFLVQAQINLEELNEILHINLPQRDGYQTLGGFLLYQLQKIPSVGEICQYQNIEFTVISLDGPRLHQIQIQYLGEKCMR